MESNEDNGWPLAKLSVEASKSATEFCSKGTAIACSVCCQHDESLRDFGVILSRKPFYIGNFNEYCKSARHKDNVIRKMNFEEEELRRLQAKEPPLPKRKKYKQGVLSFATANPTTRQVRSRILGGVAPSLAAGDHHMNVETFNDDTSHARRNGNLDKKCLGIFAVKDVIDDKVLQRGLSLTAKYYALSSEKTGSAMIEQRKVIENSHPRFSLFAINCIPHMSKPRKKGSRRCCDACNDIVTSSASPNFVKNQRAKIIRRLKLLVGAEKVREGTIELHSPEAGKNMTSYLSINKEFLSSEGKELRGQLIGLRKYHDKSQTKNPMEASSYLRHTLAPFWIEHGEEMQNTVFFDMFQNIMERMKGKQNHQLGERAMDLLMMIDSVSPKASRILSANIHGPCVRSLRRHKKKADVTSLGNGTEVPIICRTIENATHIIVEHHKSLFKKK